MKNKATVVTLDGTVIDLLDIDVSKISIHVIAHTLSFICRFFGQIENFYSVAEHSINAYLLAVKLYPNDSEIQKQAFCHEFAESMFGDMPSPLKYSPPLAGYMFLEKSAMKLFYLKHCGNCFQSNEVSHIDKILLAWEAYHLNIHIFNQIQLDNPEIDLYEYVEIGNNLGKPIVYSHSDVRDLFLKLYEEIFSW